MNDLLDTVLRVGASSVLACGACAAALWLLPMPHGALRLLGFVGGLALVGALGTYAMMKVLRVAEVAVVEDLVAGVRRRLLGR